MKHTLKPQNVIILFQTERIHTSLNSKLCVPKYINKYFENLTKFVSIWYFILFSISNNSFNKFNNVTEACLRKSINLKFGENKEKLVFHENFFDSFSICLFTDKKYSSSSKILKQKQNPTQNKNEN